MDADSIQDSPVPTADGFAFIGVVHGLMGSAKSSTKADLTLAAVMQALFESDRDLQQVQERVHEIWPGSKPNQTEIASVLTLGEELGLTTQSASLYGPSLWTLTANGLADVQQHQSWVHDMRSRAAAEVQERAAQGLQATISSDQAHLLLDRLVRSLALGIRASQDPYLGQVEALLTGQIIPKSLDKEKVLSSIGDGDDPQTTFLRTLAFGALDPIDPFGNDLVSHITTGCVLHAYAAGIDRSSLLSRVGPAQGQRVVLDTPILIDLLGPKRLAEGLDQTIRTAVAAEWEVVVLEHSILETQEVLIREVPKIKEDFHRAVQQGMKEEWYASLTQDQLPSLCIEVLREGTYTDLNELLTAARDLSDRLTELGVRVRPHFNGDDYRVGQLRAALTTQLESETGTTRSQPVIDRDANTMAVAWRWRRHATTGKWPGGWIITKDRAMNPAYSSVNRVDRVPLVITGAQWAALLTVSASPVEVEELARMAAEQFVDEAMWALPARFPPDVAFDLAKKLSPEHGGSETDMRVAQLTLDDALDWGDSSATLAGRVLSARQRRVNELSKSRSVRLEREVEEQKKRVLAASAEATASKVDAVTNRNRVTSLEQEKADVVNNLEWRTTQMRRMGISGCILAVGLVIAVASIFTAGAPASLFLATGFLVLLFGCHKWVNSEEASLIAIIVGGILNLIGVISGLLQIWDSF